MFLKVNTLFSLKGVGFLCHHFLYQAVDNASKAEGDYGYEDKDRAVHKEGLGKYTDQLVVIPTEQPVVLAGEEYHVENGERHIEVYCNQAANHAESAEGVCTRAEGNIHTEGTPKLKGSGFVENNKDYHTDKRDDKCGYVQVEKTLAVYEVRYSVLRILKLSGGKLPAGNGQVIKHVVVCLHDGLTVKAGVLLYFEIIYLPVVEGSYVDR